MPHVLCDMYALVTKFIHCSPEFPGWLLLWILSWNSRPKGSQSLSAPDWGTAEWMRQAHTLSGLTWHVFTLCDCFSSSLSSSFAVLKLKEKVSTSLYCVNEGTERSWANAHTPWVESMLPCETVSSTGNPINQSFLTLCWSSESYPLSTPSGVLCPHLDSPYGLRYYPMGWYSVVIQLECKHFEDRRHNSLSPHAAWDDIFYHLVDFSVDGRITVHDFVSLEWI